MIKESTMKWLDRSDEREILLIQTVILYNAKNFPGNVNVKPLPFLIFFIIIIIIILVHIMCDL